ncbi:hypothetical protein KBY58_08065 [Cyanobium sp. HWJ4-Hawea]|uniref:hypothetical protein n=1 Tax=unclassified Cyanobium TaxID=2627006 RepID=UPI0020CEC78D|nr:MULTISPECIES: hypothetical protein [unclassified Cyanobium]MCP9774202.1 hypothetical protein [Cyanobium sp. WAJ14-Wanaka]MCP9809386.1 hypothetical protein [Cyanobium sp. HWJ4-Hawea]
MAPAPKRPNASLEMPDWAPWVQAGFSAMLAVLFLVLVGKMREQGSQIRTLQERVQGLENSRALAQNSGLEEQLRSAVERLQVVERNSAQVRNLLGQNQALKEQVRQLKAAGNPNLDGNLPELPPIKP